MAAALLHATAAACSGKTSQGEDAAVPNGHTRIAFALDGVPTILDLPEGRIASADPAPIADGAFSVQISRDGQAIGFCVRLPDRVFGGPMGAINLLVQPDNFCVDLTLLPGGAGLAWLEQVDLGDFLLHVVDFQNGSLTVNPIGGLSMWSPVFSPDGEHLYVVRGEGSDSGPILRLDWRAGTWEEVSTLSYRSPIDVAPDGRIAASLGMSLYVIDPHAGTEEEVLTFPVAPPDCIPRDPSSLPGCFLEVNQPAFSPDGRQVTFMARGSPNLTDDTEGDIFVLDASSLALTRITEDTVIDRGPRFGGLGIYVYWQRWACEDDEDPVCQSIVRAPAQGTGPIEPLVTGTISEISVAWPEVTWPAE